MSDTAVAPVVEAPALDRAASSEPLPGFTRAIWPETVEEPLVPAEPSATAGEPTAVAVPDSGTDVPNEGTRPRDEKGRFAKTVESAPAEGPPVNETPPLDETAVNTAVNTEPPAPTLPDGTPWAFKVEGQEYGLDGAKLIPNVGLLIPDGQMDALQRWLGRGVKYEVLRARDEAKVRDTMEGLAAQQEETRLQAEYFAWLAKLQPEDALKEILTFSSSLGELRAEAKANHYKRQLDARERATQPSPQELHARALEHADGAVREIITDLKASKPAWAAGLTDTEWSEIEHDLTDLKQSFVTQAPNDDETLGIQRGEWVLHEAGVRERAQRMGTRLKSYRDQLTAAEKRTQLASQNATRQQAVVTAPPTVSGNPSATPRKDTAQPPVFKTREDWYAWIQKQGA